MGYSTRILMVVTAPPGWHNVYLTDSDPWYLLEPIALWAEVEASGSPEPGEPACTEKLVMGLSGTSEIHTPIAPPSYIRDTGYYGVIHEDEITSAVKHAWEFEARFRVFNGDLDLMQMEEPAKTDAKAPCSARYGVVKLDRLMPAKHSVPTNRLKLLQRVPASPGWFNVYLLDQEPWYLLRAIALWMLVRARREHVSPLRALLSLEPLFERPSIIGVDGRLDSPAAGGSAGFFEMTHKSAITPEAIAHWVSIAKAVLRA